ncbi:hypothetical protein K0O23_14875 [Pontibacter aydingkolensis]|uniref:Small multi-drug export protein n=1 Tax=Pontibacter aydingkolensis TaxID=1911536 RepID=A0ABS7CX49_9BACT|nr:hypothetical protein [Pontibacter aydingkolensis]
MSVYLVSMVKFIGGPLAGMAAGLTYLESVLLTIAGMMTTVIIFSIIGRAFARWWSARLRAKNRPIFNKKNRRIIKVWNSFGVVGVAFLTPVIFTPILGTIVAALFGASRRQIFIHMLWSAILWSALLNLMVFEFGDIASEYF